MRFITAASPPAVVLPGGADERWQFAAAEAARYLSGILAAPVRVGAPAGGPAVRLERSDDEGLGDEGYELAAGEEGVRISAAGGAGIVYGVYEFLRGTCGCRFAGLGPDGEHVPRVDSIPLPPGRRRFLPRLWYRGLQFTWMDPLDVAIQRIDWMAKNGMNYVMVHPVHESGGEVDAFDPATGLRMLAGRNRYTNQWFRANLLPEIRRRGLKVDMNHHNLLYWLPPADHFERHPEWYALRDGRRSGRSGQLSLCTTNERAVEALIGNVLAYLRDSPETSIVGVIPEDGRGMCECDACRRLDGPARQAAAGASFTTMEGQSPAKVHRYALLVNQVARAVGAEFPGVHVGMSAYADMAIPPEVRLEANVVPWVAIYWRCSAHPLAPEGCRVNAFYHDVLTRWRSAHAGRLILYEYYMGMNTYRSQPFPAAEVICREWPGLKRLGIDGATVQSTGTNHNIYGLNYQAFARSGWEDEVSFPQLLAEHLEGMFGSAAPLIEPIYRRLAEAVKRIEEKGPEISPFLASRQVGCFRPSPWGINYLVQPGESELFLAHAAVALDKTRTDREVRQVQDLIAAIRYWQMAAEVFAVEARAEEAERAGHIDVAIALYEEVVHRVKPVVDHVQAQPRRGWIFHSGVADQFRRNTVQRVLKRIEALRLG